MNAIVQNGSPVLREKARPVPKELFGTPELAKMIADMTDALAAESDGVAIAAPQIGLPYRIFLVRHDRYAPERPGAPATAPEVGVFINPEIIRTSRRRELMDEGCLSVRGMYGKTKRYERATVRAQDEHGKKFERGGGGILAQIFQHEIDHLEGILFIDHAIDIYEVDPKDHAHSAHDADEA